MIIDFTVNDFGTVILMGCLAICYFCVELIKRLVASFWIVNGIVPLDHISRYIGLSSWNSLHNGARLSRQSSPVFKRAILSGHELC